MATKKQCDRCKSIYNISGYGCRVSIEVFENNYIAGQDFESMDIDLCSKCTMDLRSLLNNPPPQQETKR